MSSKELRDWGLKKKIYLYGGASGFALEEVRLTHNADQRAERRLKEQSKNFV